MIPCPLPRRLAVEGLLDTGTPVVLVVTGGSAVALGDLHDRAAAVLYLWYAGEEGGTDRSGGGAQGGVGVAASPRTEDASWTLPLIRHAPYLRRRPEQSDEHRHGQEGDPGPEVTAVPNASEVESGNRPAGQ